MHTHITLKTYVDVSVNVDLDSCADVNVVDIAFVRKYKLQ
jgi:hypothetical protein